MDASTPSPADNAAVTRLLAESPPSLSEDAIAARFSGKGQWKKRLPQIIETLIAPSWAQPMSLTTRR